MSSKKKLTITIASLCCVVVVAVVAVVAVFAATNQTVKSSFVVKYTAKNVAATVSASYQIYTSEGVAVDTEGEGYGLIGSPATFTANESETSKTVSTSNEITLTDTNTYVVISYLFTNNSSSVPFTITTTNTIDGTNVNISYSINGTDYYDNLDSIGDAGVVTVEADGSATIYMKIAIANIANDVSIECDDSNCISFALESTRA